MQQCVKSRAQAFFVRCECAECWTGEKTLAGLALNNTSASIALLLLRPAKYRKQREQAKYFQITKTC
jgi:hypothetical protein